MSGRVPGLGAGALALLALMPARLLRAQPATVMVNNFDGAGEGFNDPTPFNQVGGNTATTLGQARLNAFTHAASIWGQKLSSAVSVRVDARIDPLTCSPTSAILGQAGALTVHRDFPGAPLANTWYPQALANALAGVDLAPPTSDIQATFNGAIDAGACLGGTRWYYGLDGAPPPGDLDFVTVVLHEIGHGLGFQTFVALSSGAKLLGRDDAFERKLEHRGALPPDYPSMTDSQRVAASTADPNLQWLGALVNAAGVASLSAGVMDGQVRLHGPATQQPGSSVSHFSTALAPDQLMEPFYGGPDHDVDLTLLLLQDLGWTANTQVAAKPVPAWSAWGLGLLAMATVAAGVRALRRRSA